MGHDFFLFRLANTDGFGTRAIHYVLDTLKLNNRSLSDMFAMSITDIKELLPSLGNGRLKKGNPELLAGEPDDSLRTQFDTFQQENISLCSIQNEQYPARLIELLGTDAPPMLYSLGAPRFDIENTVAVVGARNASSEKNSFAKYLAEFLSLQGYTICSGFAKGIDRAAYAGAVALSKPSINILSYGINHIRSRSQLLTTAERSGAAIVSQFRPNELFSAYTALTRNKVVCALSSAVVVIVCGSSESGKTSGTFHAANTAMKLNIPVFVYFPTDSAEPISPGNLELAELGAVKFESAEVLHSMLTELTVFSSIASYSQ